MTPPTPKKRVVIIPPSTTKMTTRKTAASIFGDGLQKDAVASPTPAKAPATSTSSGTPATLKRKATDPKLEIITVDPMYDLTVIVGTLEHSSGQKAFQINKGSFRNVSTVWSKMLSGEWKESNMSEICFPDDNCEAFSIVLQIAHFQFYQLPEKLSVSDLVELAVLTDKYELYNAVRIGLEMKLWLQPYHKSGAAWPASTSLQEFTIITSAFQMQNDFQYLSNRLAMEVLMDEAGDYYLMDDKQNKTTLRSDLPPKVTQEIKRIRQSVRSAWTASCAVGFSDTINAPVPQCGQIVCAATKIGVLLRGLKAAGFYPGPSSTEVLRGSILSYWKSLADIGQEYKPYKPYKGLVGNGGFRRGYSYQSHESACSFDKCFGDFGIVNEAKATLRRFAHKDLWEEYKISPKNDPFLDLDDLDGW